MRLPLSEAIAWAPLRAAGTVVVLAAIVWRFWRNGKEVGARSV